MSEKEPPKKLSKLSMQEKWKKKHSNYFHKGWNETQVMYQIGRFCERL